MTCRLILMRDGESLDDENGILTGWGDPALSEEGIDDAREAGKFLREHGARIDFVFTSKLKRSIATAWEVCMASENFRMPVISNWRLNERHFGALQGLTTSAVTEKYGQQQVRAWQEAYDAEFPVVNREDPRHPGNDPCYRSLAPGLAPAGESMADVVRRVTPYWEDNIAKCLKIGKRVLVVAHKASLAVLYKMIEGLSEEQTLNKRIPKGVAILCELDANLKLVNKVVLTQPGSRGGQREASKVLQLSSYMLRSPSHAVMGRTHSHRRPSQPMEHYDIIVIGAGPAGLKAATEAGRRGKRVALIDTKRAVTGAPTGAHSKCLRAAALSGAKTWEDVDKVLSLAYETVRSRAARMLRAARVQHLPGKATLVDENTVCFHPLDGEETNIATEAIVIATGSNANRFPPTDFTLPGVYDSDTVAGIQRIPEVLLVQGAGIVSVEYALIFAKLGSKVIVVEAFSAFLPMIDSSLKHACKRALDEHGVEVFMNTPLKSVEAMEGSTQDAPKIRIAFADRVVECDTLLSATGRHGVTKNLGLENLEPKGLKIARGGVIEVDEDSHTGVGKVYAVGDCATGSMGLATIGVLQATRAVRALYSKDRHTRKEKVMNIKPFAVWTIPELAWAGITEQQAKAEGIDYGVSKVTFKSTIKGCVTNEDGFLKLIFHRGTGAVLGVHICGEESPEIVNFGAEAINSGETIFSLLNFVFPAVTYHVLYNKAATEAKIRFMGARNIAARMAWKRFQAILKKTLKDKDSQLTMVEVLDKAFRSFDSDNSGFLSPDNLRDALMSLGLELSDEEVLAMVNEATSCRNGNLAQMTPQTPAMPPTPKRRDLDYETFLETLLDGEEQAILSPRGEEEQSTKASSQVDEEGPEVEEPASPKDPWQRQITADIMDNLQEIGHDDSTFDLVVLGGGPAGARAATEAGSRGRRVALIEAKGCITAAPTGAHSKCLREAVLDGAKSWAEAEAVVSQAMENAQHEVARSFRTFFVEHLKGYGTILNERSVRFDASDGTQRTLETDAIVIATGSKSNRFPPTNFEYPGVFDSDTIGNIDYVPRNLVVQGAGIISVEYAQIFAHLGSKVVIVDAFSDFLPMIDESLKDACKLALTSRGVEVIMGTPFKSVSVDQGTSHHDRVIRIDLGGRVLECDTLLAACGRHGNTKNLGLEVLEKQGLKIGRGGVIEVDANCYTGVGRVYAVGDCASGSMGLATMGTAQAVRAVRHIYSTSGLMDQEKQVLTKPFCVWTLPELAWAGLTEEKARSQGLQYGTTIVDLKRTMKGCISDKEGFLKLIFDEGSGKVLGVHLCGEHASELINFGAEVVNEELTIFDVLGFVFPAVTYHYVYHIGATESKIRFLQGKSGALSASWSQLQEILGLTLRDSRSKLESYDVLKRTFRHFDHDSSGFLSASQLHRALSSLGLYITETDVLALMAEATGDSEEIHLDYGNLFESGRGVLRKGVTKHLLAGVTA